MVKVKEVQHSDEDISSSSENGNRESEDNLDESAESEDQDMADLLMGAYGEEDEEMGEDEGEEMYDTYAADGLLPFELEAEEGEEETDEEEGEEEYDEEEEEEMAAMGSGG